MIVEFCPYYTGLSIQRSSSVFTVGESASFTCSSDLSVTSVKWLHNFQILAYSSSPELSLIFNPVNDSVHGNEYTCQVTTPYGIQEQTVQVIAQGIARHSWTQKLISIYIILITCSYVHLNSNNNSYYCV